MKVFIAFAILIAGISAVPNPGKKISLDFSDERIVSGRIEKAIEDLSQSIKDAGLDPLQIKRESSQYELPVPEIFNYAAFVEDILSTGLSNIVVNRINYNLITSRLTFDLELPLIHFSAGAVSAEVMVLSKTYDFNLAGTFEVEKIRVVGEVRVSIGIISGISIRSLSINLTLGGINSDLELYFLGNDYSNQVNDFLGNRLVASLKAHGSQINELLEIVLLKVINDNLP